MTAKSLQHSFWLILLVSFVMIGLLTFMASLREIGNVLLKMDKKTRDNWVPWLYTLEETTQGLETIAWTVYGNAMGTFVLLIFLDAQHDMPLFLYFVPFYFFLFGFYAIGQEKIRSYSLRSQVEDGLDAETIAEPEAPKHSIQPRHGKLHF